MAGAVKHAKLNTNTARSKLKRGRQPHWQALVPGKVHLGYQRWKGEDTGRWVLRRYIGNYKYRTETLAGPTMRGRPTASTCSRSEQADAKARAMVGAPTTRQGRQTSPSGRRWSATPNTSTTRGTGQ